MLLTTDWPFLILAVVWSNDIGVPHKKREHQPHGIDIPRG